ncbi:adenosylcobinamide-GDP ribazoletransferase [Alicyclobacillus contaminans]|uniref:adenosylcobinamide-GDP ribazoletransferase n=1 Tax=Alicyclobacillus contaminans TaxID=392016 RepID=UPI000402FBFF|nr:adenosylcobinamide-GDP ribazoletransferase [Alicyclobacillus contaminans]GMA48779.1 adenosylcobinamide-GDP ribazoletransferase [Alicyclobacillus contaminans]
MLRTWFLALQFCTILPVPRSGATPTVDDLRRSVIWYPAVGVMLGAAQWLVQSIASHWLPASLTAGLGVLALTVLTGGLHLDGLMDTMDAVGSRQRGDAALDIMKDSRVGAMGVLAAIFAIGLKAAASAAVPASDWLPFLWVPCVSRAGLVASMNLAGAARPGQGLGAIFARQVPWWVVTCAVGTPFLLLALGGAPVKYLMATAGMGLWMWACVSWLARRFGGMTGDTYGGLHEMLEVGGFVIAAALSR